MRSFISAWMVMASISSALALAGCAPEPRPRLLTEPCDGENECESRLSCVAGRCTAPCTADLDCHGLEPVDLLGWPASCHESYCEIFCDPAPEYTRCPLLSECVAGPGLATYCKPAP